MSLARGLILPLVRRIQIGEGALLAINGSLLFARPVPHPWARFVFSAAVLAAMYALNDCWDARRDMINPRKDQELASLLHRHRSRFAVALVVLHLLLVLVGSRLGVGLVTLAVLSVNALYSFALKGVPIVDVVMVGVWGAAYAALVEPGGVLLAVGAMTAASHVFQAMGDREADLRSGVVTSAASRRLGMAMLAGSCFFLVIGLRPIVGLPISLLGLAPLVAVLAVRRSYLAWLASKLTFGLAWLVVLWKLHGAR